jgi:GNAT superfamily N-acetyltransferase
MSSDLLDRIDGANQAVYTETARRSGGTVETRHGFVCVVGAHPSPIIANVAFRPPSSHAVSPRSVGTTLREILDRYRSIGHGVSLMTADRRDADIVDALSSDGWRSVIELPGMHLGASPTRRVPRSDVSLDWVDPDRHLSTFRRVLQDGFADEEDERQMIAAVFAEPASLAPPGIRAIVASVAGTPASCGVAYEAIGLGVIGWVATLPAFRRRGLGTLVTAAAADALLDSGVTGVTLQASPDGLPVYEKMGFREVTRYAIWLPPEDPMA